MRQGQLVTWIEDSKEKFEEKIEEKQIAGKIDGCDSNATCSCPSIRVCSICLKSRYNARTCEKDIRMSDLPSFNYF